MNACRKKKLFCARPEQRRDSGERLTDDLRGPSEALGRARKKKLAKDGGGGTAVGTLLNKALLLGNSSNSTKQWGGGGVLQ